MLAVLMILALCDGLIRFWNLDPDAVDAGALMLACAVITAVAVRTPEFGHDAVEI